MDSLLNDLKQRRIALGLKQHDMLLKVGISRQQYQRLESKGNPRLDTLDLIAKGLKSELMLIPQEKLSEVKAILARSDDLGDTTDATGAENQNALANNPWQGLLEEDEQ